ncbi:hypothetical protein Goarm_005470 [Gossypium armourianum]|uniref:Uncharacterized protein n=1 Tax=Gossypium armourianum TaxID=34283 RepID=A0A7J9K005_9ROSI|nr:hypothetical protein [Gossypium armourianum]
MLRLFSPGCSAFRREGAIVESLGRSRLMVG